MERLFPIAASILPYPVASNCTQLHTATVTPLFPSLPKLYDSKPLHPYGGIEPTIRTWGGRPDSPPRSLIPDPCLHIQVVQLQKACLERGPRLK